MTSPSRRPVAPLPSATLVLVRRHRTPLEVYLLRRSAASSFMPGTYVFPGGTVDPGDLDETFWRRHVDLGPRQLSRHLGGDAAHLLPRAVAAIRETWEEAGLLLGNATAPAGNPPPEDRATDAFRRRVARDGIRLGVSRLGRWHHWITPEAMPRRFDTHYFVAAVESGQNCSPDQREAEHGIWITPRRALVDNARGALPLSPPTLVTLHQMLPYRDLSALIVETRRRPWPAPIMPRLWPLDESVLIVEPWDPDYRRPIVRVDADRLEHDILPVGAPFARLWRRGGVCRPVRHPHGAVSDPWSAAHVD